MPVTETATAQPKKPAPPYIPYRTFINLLNGWHVHLPQRIDRSVLGSYSGATQSAILSSLRYLALVHNDDTPTGVLDQLVKSEGGERQKLLKQLLRTGYPFMFSNGFDLTKATPAMIKERFAETGASGETLEKCLSFFTALAKDAGVALTPFLKTRQRRQTNGKRTAKTPKVKDAAGGEQPAEAMPDGFARFPIPGIENAYIQYPLAITDATCDLFEATIPVLRMYAKIRSGGKEKKS